MPIKTFLLASVLLVPTPASAVDDALDRYNVVWDAPSKDHNGSMPIGNGDVGLNVWVEEGGDLLLLISKTDAWSENCRLLKLGRVRVKLAPNPFADGPFRQELRLRQGEIAIAAGEGEKAVSLTVWVDARRPVVRIEAEGASPLQMQAVLEVWRTERRQLVGKEVNSAYGLHGSPTPVYVYPDTVLEDQQDCIVWRHRNESSIWADNLKLQSLEGFIAKSTDPLLHRTFGGRIEGDNLVSENAATLKSAAPQKRFVLSIYPLCAQTATAAAWVEQLDRRVAENRPADLEQDRAAHRAWWNEFWSRSWIRATTSDEVFPGDLKARPLTKNALPLRIGADSAGANRFVGDVDRATVYRRALTPEEIAAHAAGRMPPDGSAEGCVGDWSFNELTDGTSPSAAPGELPAKVVGKVELVEGRQPSAKAVRLSGGGYLEVAHCDALDLVEAVTLEAWIRPQRTTGRILDKTQAAQADGYMLDTHPGNSLRLVLEDGNMTSQARLAVGHWVHVAGVFDAVEGRKELYVGGQLVASGKDQPPDADPRASDPAYVVSRGYALQRFIGACAGRGAFPIKFNGSIFTVDGDGFDADYRRWGGPYWWQNTRLPYWPMLAAGDFDMMQPLFQLFLDALPLRKHAARTYYDHAGAFYPETMYFWGTYANANYGFNRQGKPPGLTDNQYIRRYWQGGLELTALMLDYYDATADEAFRDETLLPLAVEIVAFFDQHWPRNEQGKVHFHPAQSLETWWAASNPLPEIAGLRFLLPRLLKLPIDASQKAAWQKLLDDLPPIPLGGEDGRRFVLPAEQFASRHNSENPELYAVFPYRLYGVGKPGLDVGRLTFARRGVKGNSGWRQDDTQAALLGLTETAVGYVVGRAKNKHAGSRFPAFWGPNFDWIPDQDHGGNLMRALQAMLLQADDGKILLLPAWPKQWDVEFKLHAPQQTTVEGTFRAGKLEHLNVSPESRRTDVIVMPAE